MDYSEIDGKSRETTETTSSVPLSECAKKLDQQVKKCNVEKISAIKIDPKTFGTGLFTSHL